MKICLKCNKEKELDDFCNRKDKIDGKHIYCRSCLKKSNDIWYNDTKNQRKEYYKNYQDKNREYYRQSSYEHYHNNKEYYRKWEKDKLKKDSSYRIKKSVMALIYFHLIKNNEYKTKHTIEYLGCTIEEYRVYLESKFTPEMNWENYGTYWEIDHIKPIDSFNLNNPEELNKCFHYNNTQPMYWKDNREKSNKIIT